MYRIKIGMSVKIQGCPEKGLAAVDFRLANGLLLEPTNTIALKFAGDDEALCRRFPGLLNGEADLVLEADSQHAATWQAGDGAKRVIATKSHRYSSGYVHEGRHTVPAEAIVAFLYHGDLGTLVEALLAAADRVDEALAGQEAERDARDAENARLKEERDRAEVERRAKVDEGVAKLKDWVHANGSGFLLARIEGGFKWVSEAETEYAETVMEPIVKELALREAETPSGYEYLKAEDRLSPSLPEMELVRRLKARCEGLPAVVEAKMVSYRDEDDQDDSLTRPEVWVTVTSPSGGTDQFEFLTTPATTPAVSE